jgi:hypothetical protein
MKIKFPTFYYPYLKAITFCGQIKPGKKKINIFEKAVELTSQYTIRDKKAFIHIAIASSKQKYKHLHIDCALPIVVKKSGMPKNLQNIEEINDFLSSVGTHKLEVDINALFHIPTAEISTNTIIKIFSIEHKKGNFSIHLDSGTISIKGAPIYSLSWSKMDEKKTRIVISGEKTETFGPEYMINLTEFIINLFKVFLLGGDNGR